MHASRLTTVLSLLSIPGLLVLGGCPGDTPGDGGGSGTESAGTTAATGGETDDPTGGSGVVPTGGADSTGTGGDASTSVDPTATEGDTEEPPGTVPCLDEQFVNGPSPGPDYTKFPIEIGSHCQGTNNQDITDIERVVFVGDSVSVGTRPTPAGDFYRAQVASELASLYNLAPPDGLWNQANPISGTSVIKESGDFASCAVWGARNDDLQGQLEDCFTPEQFDLRTLVVYTMGGNDVASIAKDAIDGVETAILFEELDSMVAFHESAVQWLTEAGRFPNGIFVVNANVYEFTDYTADVLSCPAAGTAGFNGNPPNADLLLASLNLINEEYMRIAVENGTDVVFMFEGFCGHGFHADDPSLPCYRGPGSENWFDFTCIHPTSAGHNALAEMFVNVISE